MYFEKKVIKVGDSLAFEVPSIIADALSLADSTKLYVCMDGDRAFYATKPIPNTVCISRVKPRPIARHGSRTYYVLTIPAFFANATKLEPGSSILVVLDGDRIAIKVK